MQRFRYVVANTLLLLHLAILVGEVFRSSPFGKMTHTVAGPYVRFFGLQQSWEMFAPNPPKFSFWSELTGITEDGQRVLLPYIAGPPVIDGEAFPNERLGKLDRNLMRKDRQPFRSSVVRRLCIENSHLGPFRYVQVDRVERHTPTPKRWLKGERRKDDRHLVEHVPCP